MLPQMRGRRWGAENMIAQIEQFNDTLHRIVWGPWTLVLILAVGLMYTVKGRCFHP